MLVENNKTKRNWAGNQIWTPEKTFYPNTLEDVREVVKTASIENKKVKVVGSGHSFSACSKTEGLQVNTTNLKKILAFDPENLLIEVEAGIVLRDLYKFLDEKGVALPSLPNTDSITLGGAVANCTHGTNVHFGTFSSYVVGVKLLTANGDLLNLNRHDENEVNRKYFEASLASFGSIGIFYSITLQLVPTYDILCSKYTSTTGEAKKNITQIAKNHDSAQFIFLPFSNSVLIKTQDKLEINSLPYCKTPGEDNIVVDTIFYFFKPTRLKVLTKLFQYVSRTYPFLFFIRRFYKSELVGKWWEGEVSKEKTKFFTMEYAVALHDIEKVLDKLFDIAKVFEHSGEYTRNLPFILRPVGADEIGFLSPAYKRETCYIDILFQSNDGKEVRFYKEMEKALLCFGGRVAWSRKFFATGPEVLANYPKQSSFLAVMMKLDPKGMFSNDFASGIFSNS